MPVPVEDILCRFIRPQDWSTRDQRPKPSAFKQAELSLWHQERLGCNNVSLRDLQIENLKGCGQAHHKSKDYLEFAPQSAENSGELLQVQVKWRPEDEFVEGPWREWRYAHVQVEAISGPPKFTREFRRLLALNSRVNIPPLE